jgi:hypothetical protein
MIQHPGRLGEEHGQHRPDIAKIGRIPRAEVTEAGEIRSLKGLQLLLDPASREIGRTGERLVQSLHRSIPYAVVHRISRSDNNVVSREADKFVQIRQILRMFAHEERVKRGETGRYPLSPALTFVKRSEAIEGKLLGRDSVFGVNSAKQSPRITIAGSRFSHD